MRHSTAIYGFQTAAVEQPTDTDDAQLLEEPSKNVRLVHPDSQKSPTDRIGVSPAQSNTVKLTQLHNQ